jgi:hypothetical protein
VGAELVTGAVAGGAAGAVATAGADAGAGAATAVGAGAGVAAGAVTAVATGAGAAVGAAAIGLAAGAVTAVAVGAAAAAGADPVAGAATAVAVGAAAGVATATVAGAGAGDMGDDGGDVSVATAGAAVGAACGAGAAAVAGALPLIAAGPAVSAVVPAATSTPPPPPQALSVAATAAARHDARSARVEVLGCPMYFLDSGLRERSRSHRALGVGVALAPPDGAEDHAEELRALARRPWPPPLARMVVARSPHARANVSISRPRLTSLSAFACAAPRAPAPRGRSPALRL